MGQAKRLMMEIQEMGDWPDGLQDRFVCADHFDDEYLKQMVLKNAKPGVCSYCGKRRNVCTLQSLATDITWKIHQYYNSADEEGLFLASSFYDDDKEEIAGARRLGIYIAPEDMECYESARELLDDLGLTTDNWKLDNDIENVFQTQEWVKKSYGSIETHARLHSEWLKFAKEVTEKRRFTFLAKPEFADLALGKDAGYNNILSNLSRMINEQKLCVTLKHGTTLYRSRTVDNIDDVYGFKELTSAPAESAWPNRMSPVGIGMFYGSFDEGVAKEECVGSGKHFVVGKFVTIKDLRIIDLTRIPKSSFWMPYWQENIFLHIFHQEITKPLDDNDKNSLRYIPTQIFTEFLRYMFREESGDNVSGLVYSSAKEQNQRNIVLFCDNASSKKIVDLKEVKKYKATT